MTTMTKLSLALALAFAGASYSTAADEIEKKFNAKPVLLFGYAFGGDDMGTLEYDDGSSSDVSAGGGFTMGGGFDFIIDAEKTGFSKDLGVQLTGAYKFDSATAENADITMDRFEFTVLPYVAVNDKVTVGAGISFHTGVELSTEMDGAGSDSIEFDAATAFVGEIGIQHSAQLKWGIRFTSVEYTPASLNGRDISDVGLDKVGGNNFGGFVSFYFK